jgi:DUF177 domain-containing protein
LIHNDEFCPEFPMKDQPFVSGLQIDVSKALPSVGDRRRVSGTASLRLEDVYYVTFEPGDEITWDFQVRRIAGGVEVTGTIAGVVTLTCYRCLEGFEFGLSLDVREHALWLSEAELEEDEEPATEYMVTDGVLDLEPIIRDTVCLAFPARRICDEACRGLCNACGANLNLETCGCDTGHIDARLKPLEELKKRLESGA